MNETAPLLSVTVDVGYGGNPPVLRGLSLAVNAGEIVGLVGHSGSGKSTLALTILRLIGWKGGHATGSVVFAGRELMSLGDGEMRSIRGREIGFVPQSPLASLNPALKIGTQMREAWFAHARGTREACEARIREVLRAVALPDVDEILGKKPAQLSVGQGQRVLIAMAILHSPKLILADEPTSALDMITQTEVLELLARLNREMGIAVLYISHDLLAVASVCHRIAILHEGKIVEFRSARELFADPRHEFTRRLVASIPTAPRS